MHIYSILRRNTTFIHNIIIIYMYIYVCCTANYNRCRNLHRFMLLCIVLSMRVAYYYLFSVDFKTVRDFLGGPRTVWQVIFSLFTLPIIKNSVGVGNGAGGAREPLNQLYIALASFVIKFRLCLLCLFLNLAAHRIYYSYPEFQKTSKLLKRPASHPGVSHTVLELTNFDGVPIGASPSIYPPRFLGKISHYRFNSIQSINTETDTLLSALANTL